MKIRIGFPVATKDRAFPVWVSTSPATGKGKVRWNRQQLAVKNPFQPAGSDLNQRVEKITEKYNIDFQCDELSPDSSGTIRIDGRSHGMLLALAKHFELPEPAVRSDLSILITGAVSAEDEDRPLPVGESESLRLKGKDAQNNRYMLLVLSEDYQILDDTSGKLVSHKLEAAKLPSTLDEVEEWEKQNNMGRAYILPITGSGKWPDTGEAWWKGLGKALSLTEEDDTKQRSGLERLVDIDEKQSSFLYKDLLHLPIENTIGELYSAALPTNKEFRKEFLAHNDSLCSKPLFEDGIATKAIKRRHELFFGALGDMQATPAKPTSHILIGGPTGCGKTFLAEALILNEVIERDGTTIYIAPTRSLAVEVYGELRKRFISDGKSEFKLEGDIILSTGELSKDDWRLRSNRFRIAVLVNEKANLFLRPSMQFLQRLGLIIIDELHMLSDPTRGGVIDTLIAKVHQENTRRLENGEGRALRMVGITTEALIKNEAVRKAFQMRGISADVQQPVVLDTDTRPIEVAHVARVYRSRDDVSAHEIDIVKFRNQQDRYLDDPLKISREILAQVNMLENDTRPGKLQNNEKGLSSVLAQVVLQYANDNYRTLLVATPSIPRLIETARAVKNIRQKKGYPGEPDEELEYEISRGSVGKATGETLIDLARFGIYLHHSELPRTIRELVVNRFRSSATRKDGLSEILFATETLFYGVNLSTECVILTSPLWTRDRPGALEPQQVELTANEFHNILGRAGRPGFCEDILPKAVVCFPSWEYITKRGEIHEIIERYYGNTDAADKKFKLVSGLMSVKDIRACEENTIQALDKISYPTFRSVMDALRHLGGAGRQFVFAEDVIALLQKSTFFQVDKPLAQRAEALVRKVLEVAAAEKLIEHSDNRFRIKPEAEALIDTGTKWQSVSPMKRWLGFLKEIKRDLRDAYLPVELLVPAFVSSQELWHTARTFCWESNESIERGDLKALTETFAQKTLLSELKELGLEDAQVLLVEKRLSDLVEGLSSVLPLNVPGYRKAVFYRLTTAILKWLRGLDIEQIDVLSIKDLSIKDANAQTLRSKLKSEARHFKDRYTERASWLATMCLRYFDKTDDLLPEHRRELPRLSQRLRQGVPYLGLPLTAPSPTQLSRKEVELLLAQSITPPKILKSSDPSSLLATANLLVQKPDGQSDRVIRLIEDVHNFYWNEIQALTDLLYDEDTQGPLNDFRDLMRGLFDSGIGGRGIRQPSEEDKTSFLSTLMQMLSTQDRLQVTKQSDDRSLLIGNSKDEKVIIRVLGVDEPKSEETVPVITVRLPWPGEQLSDGIELTSCGGMILAYLISRGFIKGPARALRGWMESEKGLQTVQDILELDMPSLPLERREAMLRFNEPGV